jgi:chemotaxis protein methyltransferase CheR
MTPHPHLEDHDYVFFRELIRKRVGIVIGETRRNILARALKDSAEQANCPDIPSYAARLLVAETDSELWDDLVKKLTIGESYFFRHQEQINALRRNIFPDLIARHWMDRTLRLWSAGCATGEEPYTIAILLNELLDNAEQWKISILATDINRQSLEAARVGRYRDWSLRNTEPQMQKKYFTQDGGFFTLDPAIRKMVTFAYLNLSEDKYPATANQTSHLDLILCRNVTIYLPQPVIRDIAKRFHRCLVPGGWLLVAPSEANSDIYSTFQMLVFYGNIFYQKMSKLSASGRPAEDQESLADAKRLSGFVHTPDSLHLPQRQNPSFAPGVGSIPAVPKSAGLKSEKSVRIEEQNLYEQGEAHMKKHHYDEALRFFRADLAKRPDSVLTRYRLSCLEANAGNLDQAENYAEAALRDDPLHSRLHYIMGMIQQARGKTDEALTWFKKTLYLDPDFVLAHFSLSYLYERVGKQEESQRHRELAARLAIRLSPDSLLPGSEDLTAGQLLGMMQADAGTANPLNQKRM